MTQRRPSDSQLRVLARIIKGGGFVYHGEEHHQTIRGLEHRELLDPVTPCNDNDGWMVSTAGVNAVELWWNGQDKP